jgi:FkbM family methyltransferase
MAARAAERFLNAWYNTGDFEFECNGEAFLLRRLGERFPGIALEVWDVGAHQGDYAFCAHQLLPAAHVTSFEILPAVAARIRERGFGADWFTLRAAGLSDHPGEVTVTYNPKFSTCSSIQPRLGDVWFQPDQVQTVCCRVTTIDALIAEGLAPPAFIKIDVEGHEAAVLDGARALLQSADAPAAIQFEYGDTWIPAGKTLYAVQGTLEAAGYSVGRLYPRHVEFKAYSFREEAFRMGNMVAVRDEALRKSLAG